MTTCKSKYKRCKDCKELVIDVENCANCEAQNDPLKSPILRVGEGKRWSGKVD